jgi:hypothetical protein
VLCAEVLEATDAPFWNASAKRTGSVARYTVIGDRPNIVATSTTL